MIEKWHSNFNPQRFLQNINIENFINRVEVLEKDNIGSFNKSCILCLGFEGPGLLLNDKSYLCKKCFEVVSLIQYPEKYESLRRDYILKREAWNRARGALISNSLSRKTSSFLKVLTFLSIGLLLVNIIFMALTICLFLISNAFKKLHQNKLLKWEQRFPKPKEPILKHFHDPYSELSQRDQIVLKIFNNWPGYPPFWDFLREVVIKRDHNRCQVTGCPSRLNLHVHHKIPVSEGGEHIPSNLVTLCDFHHALEPQTGHERIWGNVKTLYFTLVHEHTRRNRISTGTHEVRPHLRRLRLINEDDLRLICKTYRLSCPSCASLQIKANINHNQNIITITCKSCGKQWKGPQELAEETGPRIAEFLVATQYAGSWQANWEMLSYRKNSVWGEWSDKKVKKKRKTRKKAESLANVQPICPKCGSPMKLIKPRPHDSWKAFWGCSKYRITGCKGNMNYKSN